MKQHSHNSINASMTLKHGVLLIALTLLLSACGFHLRGAYELPAAMQTTFIEVGDPNSELVRSLKRTLKGNDVELVNSRQQAQAVLRLFNEQHSKRVLSVDSRGRAREYELSYQISFELLDADAASIIKEQTLSLQRDFLFDTEDVLGKGREEAVLINDMQQDMVRLIMMRLQSYRNESSS